MTDTPARWPCWAKINLTLEVVRRRDDGYHELASLMQTVDLADELLVEAAPTIEVDGVGEQVDPGADLVYRAAHELASAASPQSGARLTLTKRIPLAAGLGGGSSDAATTLLALDRLWDTRLSMAELTRLGLLLGSDVPFLLHGGLALVGGRGEHVQPLAVAIEQWLVLLVPRHEVHGKTAALFAALAPADFSDGRATRELAGRLGSVRGLADADLFNAFEAPARRTFDGLDGLWRSLETLAARPFHLSGAGPALFALADGEADARRLADRLVELGERVFVATFIQPDRYASPRPIRYA